MAVGDNRGYEWHQEFARSGSDFWPLFPANKTIKRPQRGGDANRIGSELFQLVRRALAGKGRLGAVENGMSLRQICYTGSLEGRFVNELKSYRS